MKPALKSVPAILWIWLACLAHGILYITTTPLWEGFDEPFHYSYIQSLVELKQIPVYGKTLVSREITASFQAAPLAPAVNSNLGNRYTTFEDFWKLTRNMQLERESALKSIPQDYRRIADTSDAAVMNYQSQHPPLYYFLACGVYQLFAGQDLPTLVFFLRAFSLLIGSLTVFIACAIARHVYQNPRQTLAIPLLIVLLPMFFSTVGRISNDSLAVPLFSLLILLTVRLIASGLSHGHVMLVGAVAGLGLLTKAYFLTAIPAIIVILLALGIRRRSVSSSIAQLLFFFIPLIAVAGWWYLRNYYLYGNISGLQWATTTSSSSFMDRIHYIFHVPWYNSLNLMFRRHIWTTNNSIFDLSTAIGKLGYLLAGLAFLGLARQFANALYPKKTTPMTGKPSVIVSAEGTRTQVRSLMIIGVLIIFYAFFLMGLIYQVLQDFILVRKAGGVGGWYLYAVVVPEVILLSCGLESLLAKRARPLGQVVLIAYASVVNFLGYFCKSIPAYSGFAVYQFHLRHFFEIYAPANLGRVLEHLSINRPFFITPRVLGIVILGHLAAMLLVLISWRHLDRPDKAAP